MTDRRNLPPPEGPESSERTGYTHDIVIVSPNSGIDSYYQLDTLKMCDVNRARQTLHTAGGKGNNMARGLVNLGGRAMSLGIVGGTAGTFIKQELDREGIGNDLVWIDKESRRMSTLCVPNHRDTTVVLEKGKPLGVQAQQALIELAAQHVSDAPYLTLIGSLPPDFPETYYAEIVQRLHEYPIKVCIDCAGDVLQHAAASSPWLIKVNRREFWTAFNLKENDDWRVVLDRFEKMQANGVHILIVTDGPNGAVVFSQNIEPFRVKTTVDSFVSSAGAGDTFIAGLLLSLGQGHAIHDATQFASAGAAANIQQLGCGFLNRDDVDIFLSQTTIESLF